MMVFVVEAHGLKSLVSLHQSHLDLPRVPQIQQRRRMKYDAKADEEEEATETAGEE